MLLEGEGQALVERRLPDPVPGPGEALIAFAWFRRR
jgi:hypothetical protein